MKLFSVWKEFGMRKMGKEDDKSVAQKSSDPHSSQSDEQEMSDDTGSDDPEGEEKSQTTPEDDASKEQDASGDASGASKQDQESSSKEPENSDQQQDASASSSDPTTKKKTESVSESPKDWFTRVTNEGQAVLWHPKASAMCPTLLTGIRSSDPMNINTIGWEGKLETANLEISAFVPGQPLAGRLQCKFLLDFCFQILGLEGFGGLRSTLSTLFINFTHKPNTLLWELALTVFDSIANWSEETTTPDNY